VSLNPKITVYLVSHNYGSFAKQAIESVLKQSTDDWELLLINDGSSDNTQEVFESYSENPKIRIFHTGGVGLPAINNLALKEAKGEYLIRLDADDFFDENILLVLSNYLDNDQKLGIVIPDFYLVDTAGKIFLHSWRKKLEDMNHIIDQPPNGACTMIRIKELRDVGGYREDLGAQDGLDLWMKLKDRCNSKNVNLPLFFYRRHGNNLTEQPVRIVNARRGIKADNAVKELNQNRPIILIIPCRRSSDFIDDLWSQKILDKSLLERDIEACSSSEMFDHIIVTCDNKESEDIVKIKQKGDNRIEFFPRETDLTLPSNPISNTLIKIANVYDPDSSGIIVMRYIQTPFVSKETIEEAVNTLIVSKTDSAFAVEEIHHEIFERQTDGLISINNQSSGVADSANLYRDSSSCIAIKTKSLRASEPLRTKASTGFVVSTVESFFIRNKNDLEIAQNYETLFTQ